MIRLLAQDAAERGEPLRLLGVTAEQAAGLEASFPGAFEVTPDRDSFDYVYDIDRLADLPGKRLHGKRNHISYFERSFSDWKFEPLTPAALPECLEMEREWYRRSTKREGAEEAGDLNRGGPGPAGCRRSLRDPGAGGRTYPPVRGGGGLHHRRPPGHGRLRRAF